MKNYEKVWKSMKTYDFLYEILYEKVWKSMEKYENEFFGRKLWIELMDESGVGDRYELMYEMIL